MWGIVVVVSALLFVAAFVVLIRKRELFSLTAAILWFFGILVVPVLGPLFLLLFTRGKRADRAE
ncbi:hypothetical protein G7068_12645 [Leucobacter viscericola]|uniref:Cardiolipin synthase N-terminal domain-containing protein n=1 Tax=Leucobacter viscericola TaxID=2714935 RepID=A0A6G7XHV7_9MICO|nr:hypothetical protein [Leucobacter viscericola]QIK63951.1 hypothetical protein G7068_12645 [Leucobacter viscericola]